MGASLCSGRFSEIFLSGEHKRLGKCGDLSHKFPALGTIETALGQIDC
jgi:hypothetical protein